MAELSKFAQMADAIDEVIEHHRRYRELDEAWLAETARRLREVDVPADWPARLYAASDVAKSHGLSTAERRFQDLALWAERNQWPEAVEAIGRALLGDTSGGDQ